MRINIDWLKDWVDLDTDPEALADVLTTAGLEVDSVSAVAPALEGVIVAEILSVEPHPAADRLSLCRVADGEREHSVVCGAPNAMRGLKVPYARVGTVLPDGRSIAAAAIRGERSAGMLCSARELGLGDDAAGLLELDSSAPVGAALGDYLRLDDAVLEIDLTPNRGDCFSVIGIAREITAHYGDRLRGPSIDPVGPASNEIYPVELASPEACPRFAGRVIRGIDAGADSPDWMKERLRRAGLRPIHAVVDVTNYVMLELGQPLHAYDLAKLGGMIRVRQAARGERLCLLDASEIELDADVLVIADEAQPIGLAGIMGGQSTAVDASTTDVFLESAFFAPAAIQGRARRFGLHTDASVRFERGVDPAQQERAIERATALLMDFGGGTPGPVVLVEDHMHVPQRAAIEIERARVESLLGLALDDGRIEEVLRRLEMSVERSEDGWLVRPPTFRFDITIPPDLIEEIGRMIGYDEIPVVPGPAGVVLGHASEQQVTEDEIADLLAARGYTEAINYTFIDERAQQLINPGVTSIRLANPISSDQNVMRRSLWPGLLKSAQQNLSRQQDRCRIFELGTVFGGDADEVAESRVVAGVAIGPCWPEHWDAPSRSVDFYDVKGDVEALLGLTGRAKEFAFERGEHPALNPGQTARMVRNGHTVGWLGSLHPKLRREFDLKSEAVLFTVRLDAVADALVPKVRLVSKYPSVRRDIAVVVDEDVSVKDLLHLVENEAGEHLQGVTVFDVYRGKGIESRRKSIGLGLILQDASRTLTDEDADGMVDSVVHLLERKLGATIRT